MIATEYRLTEHEFKKVLVRKKPFFSYVFVANTFENKQWHIRCGILLSAKCTRGSVNRNFWRRRFYDIAWKNLSIAPLDIVVVPKKWTILDYKNPEHIEEFNKNIKFLFTKIKESRQSNH
jgi:ribonuclease P protein component